RIDGAGELQIFQRVVWPLSTPGLSAVAIFTFVFVWNSYLWPLLVVNQDILRTLPLGMGLFANELTVSYNRIMAVAVYGALPLVLLFLILQRNFVRGIALTGLREG
ncbi:MAG: carbohydrate ABC transporter permease, partial [Caldilineaceae bacterium]|nr:carbohydrate ABC transporter permease [Caldilineaceae bacterium]